MRMDGKRLEGRSRLPDVQSDMSRWATMHDYAITDVIRTALNVILQVLPGK